MGKYSYYLTVTVFFHFMYLTKYCITQYCQSLFHCNPILPHIKDFEYSKRYQIQLGAWCKAKFRKFTWQIIRYFSVLNSHSYSIKVALNRVAKFTLLISLIIDTIVTHTYSDVPDYTELCKYPHSLPHGYESCTNAINQVKTRMSNNDHWRSLFDILVFTWTRILIHSISTTLIGRIFQRVRL